MSTTTTVLEQELRTFEEHRAELLTEHGYQFVLIKNDEVAGTFESQQDAIDFGYRTFGNVAFLVKQILPEDLPVNILTPFITG